jgi:hypothetical protein
LRVNPSNDVKRLTIRAISNVLPPEILEALNGTLESLVKTIDIDFADTGFYAETDFRALELLLELSDSSLRILRFLPNNTEQLLQVIQIIPATEFDMAEFSDAFEYSKEQAVVALAMVAKRYGCQSRALEIRAFHIRGSVLRGKIKRMDGADEDDEDDRVTELQIHMKLSDDGFGTPEETDFFLTTFFDTIAERVEGSDVGEIEGNDVGAGYFTLYCMGDNPKLILQEIRPYLVECSRSEQDFVLLVTCDGEEQIAIRDL